MGSEDLLACAAANAMWEREFQILGEELLDVWSADIGSLLNLNNLEDMDRPDLFTIKYKNLFTLEQ